MHKNKHDCTKLLFVTPFFIFKFTSRSTQMQKCEFANCWVNRVHHCSSLEIGIDVWCYNLCPPLVQILDSIWHPYLNICKGDFISEGIFNLVPSSKKNVRNCYPSTFLQWFSTFFWVEPYWKYLTRFSHL